MTKIDRASLRKRIAEVLETSAMIGRDAVTRELLRDVDGFLKKLPMTASEAGAIGGKRVKALHGDEFYSKIGRKGGIKTKKLYGTKHYEKIGAVGGSTSKSTHAE